VIEIEASGVGPWENGEEAEMGGSSRQLKARIIYWESNPGGAGVKRAFKIIKLERK
jgi:hypothetical protein